MNSKLSGTGQVYRFTLRQMIQNKSNQVTFLILMALMALSIPVMGFFFGDGDGSAQMTGPIAFSTGVYTVEDYLGGEQVGFETRFNVQYAYSIILMMVSIFSVTYIVRAIVEEKVSKLVETLMVSVKPLALMMGKVLAVMTFMFVMLAGLCLATGISYGITGQFMDISFIGNILENFGITADLLKMEPLTIIVIMVCLVLAYLFFSILAGLTGAGCSNMDEVEGANMTAMFAILGGFLASCFAQAMGESMAVFLSLCPVVSAFAAPVYYALGNIGIGTMAISWVIQIVMIYLLFRLSAAVYDQLIMYRGSRVKIRNILSMARGKGGR